VAGRSTSERETAPETVNVHYDVRLRQLSLWRRMQVPVLGWVVWAFIRTLGPTLRFETIGLHHLDDIHARGHQAIGAFWHRCILAAVWRWRGRGVVVLNTTNFDGQWTRRVIERLGFGTAQGSSSRGGLRGLLELEKRLSEGRDVAFTIDGPRGPRYVAKPGAVMLAQKTGQPILVFHASLESAHTFTKSWDLFQIPKPFTRAVMIVAPPLTVPRDANAQHMEAKQAEVQAALERVRDVAESWFHISEAERERIRAEWNA
jgi:lysophospholipid acyltransferase (LPLAT)-like uncharacterized protein